MKTATELTAGQLAESRRANDALRASMCHQILTGELSVLDYIYAAVADERLRKQSLIQLISSQPGTGYKAARSTVRTIHQTIHPGQPVNYRKMTVGWLVSDWSKGRRFLAFLDAWADPTRAQGHAGLPWSFGEVDHDD